MRMYKWVKRMVLRNNGYHTLCLLLVKVFEKDGKWKGKWAMAVDDRGRPKGYLLM